METIDLKVTIKRDKKVLAVVSDPEMAHDLLAETHPEVAKLFAALAQANDLAREQG